jgi:uncharacterized protein with GYD domain
MPHYMTQFSYEAEAWRALSKNPVNRFDAVKALGEKLGAHVIASFYSFGDYDGVILMEAPDNQTAAALVIAAVSPGHLKSVKTTVLLTAEEAISALRKAETASFQAPS